MPRASHNWTHWSPDFPDDAYATPSSGELGPATTGSPIALHAAVWLLPSVLLFLALFPLPYGFYVLLRFVVCGAAALLTYHEYRMCGRVSGWALALATVALMFNPIVPVHLTRGNLDAD